MSIIKINYLLFIEVGAGGFALESGKDEKSSKRDEPEVIFIFQK